MIPHLGINITNKTVVRSQDLEVKIKKKNV